MQKKCAIIGYESGIGGNITGCERAPAVLRSLGLEATLRSLGFAVTDLGDVPNSFSAQEEQYVLSHASASEKLVNNLSAVYWACQRLEQKTTQALHLGLFPLILGGDHSLSIGSISAVANYFADQGKDIGVIWIDTHGDTNTPESSPSKNIFGMSLAVLGGLVPGVLSSLQTRPPAIKPEKLVYIGSRDLDPFERQHIKDKRITTYTMRDIDFHGIGAVIQRAIDQASDRTAGFVVSFDLDVCDPTLAPAIGTPIRGGLTYREVHLCLELLHESQKMLSFEIVEFNPTLDKNASTAHLALSFLESVFGKTIL